jgi:hypothetical protein
LSSCKLSTTTRTLYTLSLQGRAVHLSLLLTHLPEEATDAADFAARVQADVLALVRARAPALLQICFRGGGSSGGGGGARAALAADVEALLSDEGLGVRGALLCGTLHATLVKTLFATLTAGPGGQLASLPAAGIELTARLSTAGSLKARTLQKLGWAGGGGASEQ